MEGKYRFTSKSSYLSWLYLSFYSGWAEAYISWHIFVKGRLKDNWHSKFFRLALSLVKSPRIIVDSISVPSSYARHCIHSYQFDNINHLYQGSRYLPHPFRVCAPKARTNSFLARYPPSSPSTIQRHTQFHSRHESAPTSTAIRVSRRYRCLQVSP